MCRGAFFCVVPIAMIVFCWQLMSLPAMKAERGPAFGNVFRLLNRPLVASGMAAVSIMFMGQFALFTYRSTFGASAGLLVIAALLAVMTSRAGRVEPV